MVNTMQLYEKRLQEIIDQHETSASVVVPELYQLLRNAGQKPKEARATLESDLSKVWKIDTIQRNLPDECKDKKAQELAKKKHSSKTELSQESVQQQSEKATKSPIVSIGAGGETLTEQPSEPYSKGAKEDREATRPEKQGFKIQEIADKLAQANKRIADLEQKAKEDDDYVAELHRRTKLLEETKEADILVEAGNQVWPVHVTVRQTPKFSVTGFIDPRKVKEMYAH